MPPSQSIINPHHGAVHADPKLVDGCHEGFSILVRDDSGNMPTCAAADHVKDDVFVDKEQITFHLSLILSGIATLHTVSGPGLAHSRHTLQV